MSHDHPAVITCAITGALANREQCPAIPYTPAEYAAEARRIVDEGGVHIHIHARTPDGTPSYEVEDFQAIKDAIVAEVGDAAIINFSTGTIGVSVEKRVAYLREVRPEVVPVGSTLRLAFGAVRGVLTDPIVRRIFAIYTVAFLATQASRPYIPVLVEGIVGVGPGDRRQHGRALRGVSPRGTGLARCPRVDRGGARMVVRLLRYTVLLLMLAAREQHVRAVKRP